MLFGHAREAERERVDEPPSPLGEQPCGLSRRDDENAAPVRRVGLAAEKPTGHQSIDCAAGRRVGRSHPVGERTEAKRGLVDHDGERKPLRPREWTLVGLLELAAWAHEKQDEPLELLREPLGLRSGHSLASDTGSSRGRGDRGVTSSATSSATKAAAAPTQKAVANADSAGTRVLPIVSAVRIAAPT